MKILKPGRVQKGWSREVTCTGNGNGGGGCGAKLLVEQADLYKTYNHSFDGDSERFVTFRCAACGVETDLSNVPGNIIDQLPDKARRGSEGAK